VSTIKVGVILPLTGKYADLGSWVNAGVQIAANDVNNDHRFDLVVEDAKSEASGAVSAYKKLVNVDGVDVVITTSSAMAMAIKPQAIRDNILLFCIASHVDLTDSSNNTVFRPCNTSKDESDVIIDYIVNSYGSSSSVGILYHNSEYGTSFDKNIKSGLKDYSVKSFPYGDDSRDQRTLANKVVAANFDVLVTIGFTPSLGQLISAVNETDFEGKIIANIGITTPSVKQLIGSVKGNILHVDYKLPSDNEIFLRYDSIAQAKYNTSFASMSYMGYSTIKVIDKAFSQNLTNEPESIGRMISKYGPINIDGIELVCKPSGDISPTLVMKILD
jgi:ABC-type branched-subunit amino acid transport system substrate-binding protein